VIDKYLRGMKPGHKFGPARHETNKETIGPYFSGFYEVDWPLAMY